MKLPSTAVTVIMAVPVAFGVTTPFASTVATSSFDDVQVTVLFVAVAGVMVAVSVNVTPFDAALYGSRPETFTPETGTNNVASLAILSRFVCHAVRDNQLTVPLQSAVSDLVVAGGITQILRNGVQGHTDVLGKLLSLFACNVIGYCHFHVLCLLVFGRYIFALMAQNSKSYR